MIARIFPTSLVVISLIAGCGGSSDSQAEYYIQAAVTMTDGSQFQFNEECLVGDVTVSEERYWSLEAKDISTPFGLSISWKDGYITGPGTHDVNEGMMDLSTMVIRAHPTDTGSIRMSSASEGSINFTAVDTEPGGLIEGTLDGIRLDRDDEDDTVHILATDGSFRCRLD